MTTAIEWTDVTWNPVVGCDQISPGCAHCYAKTLHDRRHAAALAGKQIAVQYAAPFETIQLKPERLGEPLTWRTPRRVFVNSVSDLFHESVPFEYIDRVFASIALAPRHTFQILTKRAARMREYARTRFTGRFEARGPLDLPIVWSAPLANVVLMVSAETQRYADERIPILLDTPAAVRGVSLEPLLGPIDLAPYLWTIPHARLNRLHWAIVGGESGPGARPCALEWLRAIVAQCQAAAVPVFVKQLGAVPASVAGVSDERPWRVYGFRDPKGGDPAEWPADLRVREWPVVGPE